VDEWYQTSQIGNRSLEFIEASLAAGKPFVAYLGTEAPHYNADSPPWARELYNDLKAPRTPAFNTSIGQADKTKHIAQNPPLNKEAEHWIDTHFRDRWRAIKGVDIMISLIIDRLQQLGVLENTFIFFTSDHGYKLGEWRLGCSKQHPFESDIHIPFLARGPGIAPGTRINSLGSNIDIAPTFIDIAGLPPNPEHDGKSLLPLLHTVQGTPERQAVEEGWRTSLLIEYISVGTYYNDHAEIYVSGPGETPGTPLVYGRGPWSPNNASQDACQHDEAMMPVGQGQCYFVDSQASNNWIALRVRNSTHNLVFVESFGSGAMAQDTFSGSGKGVYKCLDGDLCQTELYDYGKINTSEDLFRSYPVMDEERWSLTNKAKTASNATLSALKDELKQAYCQTRRLEVDRMGCN